MSGSDSDDGGAFYEDDDLGEMVDISPLPSITPSATSGGVETQLKEEEPSFLDPNEIDEEILIDDDLPEPVDSDDEDIPMDEEGDRMDLEEVEEKVEEQATCVLSGHSAEVYAIAVSTSYPPIVATGSGDDTGMLWLYDPFSPETTPKVVLKGHTDTVNFVTFSVNNTLLATGGMDANVRIWSPTTGALLEELEGPIDSIETLTWHPRGLVLFAGDIEGTGWMWNLSALAKQEEGRKKAVVMNGFYGHGDAINASQFTPDGKKLVTASADLSLRVWDPVSAQALHTVSAHSAFGATKWHSGSITCMAMDPLSEQSIVATGSLDGLVCLSLFDSGKLIQHFNGHTDSVESLCFLPGHRMLCSASLDGTVIVWDLTTSTQRNVLQHSGGVVRVISDTLLNHIVYTCTLGKVVSVWDARSGKLLASYTGHTDQVLDIALSATKTEKGVERTLFSASDDTTSRAWNIPEAVFL